MKITNILIGMGFLAFAGSPAEASAQDYDSLRTGTWSVYAQGGVAWAGGVAMKSVSAAAGTSVSPLVGAGLSYNIRPWVRLGLNYEFSKYKREQRFSDFQPLEPELNNGTPVENTGGLAYRNMWTHYHNVDLTAEFNLMELWPNRSSKRFNLYLGTGGGLTVAEGNTYALSMGYERYMEGTNHVIYDWMRANNHRHSFQSLYVPVVLSAEYDVTPRWAVGVRGSGKYLFTDHDCAPKNLWGAGVTVRHTFGAARRGF